MMREAIRAHSPRETDEGSNQGGHQPDEGGNQGALTESDGLETREEARTGVPLPKVDVAVSEASSAANAATATAFGGEACCEACCEASSAGSR